MRRVFGMGVLGVVLLSGGCALLSTTIGDPVSSVRIMDAPRLRGRHRLAVIPFRPGPDVPADIRTERTSLGAVRGLVDSLRGAIDGWTVVVGPSAETADVFIEGHLVRDARRCTGPRWLGGTCRREVEIRGRMTFPSDETPAAVFTIERSEPDRGDPVESGRRLGTDLGGALVRALEGIGAGQGGATEP